MAPHLPTFCAAWTAGNGIDAVAVALLAFGGLRGGVRGLTGELARVFGLAAAVALGYWTTAFWVRSAAGLAPGDGQSTLRAVLTVLGVVVTATLAGYGTRWLVDRFLRLLLDQPANAVFGAIAGTFRGALLILVLFYLASFVGPADFQTAVFERSWAGRTAHPAVQWVHMRIGGALTPALETEPPSQP